MGGGDSLTLVLLHKVDSGSEQCEIKWYVCGLEAKASFTKNREKYS